MRKLKKGRKFHRETDQRKALLASLAAALFLKEKIKTTEAKAKELRMFAEKLITRGKEQTLTARKLLEAALPSDAAKKLFQDIAPQYKDRQGGYTRITKLGPRESDSARMAIIELIK